MIVTSCCFFRIETVKKDSTASYSGFRSNITPENVFMPTLPKQITSWPFPDKVSCVIILIMFIVIWNGFVIEFLIFLPQNTSLWAGILFAVSLTLYAVPLSKHGCRRAAPMCSHSWGIERRDAPDPAQNTALQDSAPSSEFTLVHLRLIHSSPRPKTHLPLACLFPSQAPISLIFWLSHL